LFSYFAVGTVIAQGVFVGYLWHAGLISKPKLIEMLAVAHEVTIEPDRSHEPLVKPEESSEQPSLRDAREQAAVMSRNLELRMSAVANNKDELLRLVRSMRDQMEHHQNVSDAFQSRLDELQAGGRAAAREDVRLILENVRPRQAKEQLMLMLDNGEMREVVMLLSAMPDGKRKNIIGEFKTEEENQKLAEVLREIRKGGPEIDLIESTRGQLRN